MLISKSWLWTSGLWCLASKGLARAALPTVFLATTTLPTWARRRTGRRWLLQTNTNDKLRYQKQRQIWINKGALCRRAWSSLQNQDDLLQVFCPMTIWLLSDQMIIWSIVIKWWSDNDRIDQMVIWMVAFQKTVHSTGNFLGKTNSPNITVVDTPGFKVLLCS